MGKKSKNDAALENRARETSSSLMSFMIYESAYLPAMVKWAKKENKGRALVPAKELLRKVSEQNRKFLRSVNPIVYKQVLELIRAMGDESFQKQEDFNKLLEEYGKFAPEYKSLQEPSMDMDIDSLMRVSFALLTQKLDNTEDKEARDSNPSYRFGLTNISDITRNGGLRFGRSIINKLPDDKYAKDARKLLGLRKHLQAALENCPSLTRFFRPDEIAFTELARLQNIPISDFWKTTISKKDLSRIIDICCSYLEHSSRYKNRTEAVFEKVIARLKRHSQNKSEELDDLFNDEDNVGKVLYDMSDDFDKMINDFSKEVMEQVVRVAIAYKFMLLYRDARDVANSTIEKLNDLTIEYQREKAKTAKDVLKQKEKEGASLLEQKQEQLNELQVRYDKLLQKNIDLQAETDFLREILEHEDEPDDIIEDEIPVEDDQPYPKGTILFGGHENWQRKFATVHPEVKIFSGTSNFPENAVSPKTPLVLLNSRHMSHKIFYKVRRLQQRQGWEMRYLK